MRSKASHIARARRREDLALKLSSEGIKSSQDIAERLGIAPRSVAGLLQRARVRARTLNAQGRHGADCPCGHRAGTVGACAGCNCADFSAEEIREMSA